MSISSSNPGTPRWFARIGGVMRRARARLVSAVSEISSLSVNTRGREPSTPGLMIAPVLTASPIPLIKSLPLEAATETQEETVSPSHPQAVAPVTVELHVEPTSIKDFEPVDHADCTAEFGEAVYRSASVTSTEQFTDHIAPKITVSQPVFDIPQYVNLGTSLYIIYYPY